MRIFLARAKFAKSAKFFWKGSRAFANVANFARVIDSYPFRVFGVFRGLYSVTHHADREAGWLSGIMQNELSFR